MNPTGKPLSGLAAIQAKAQTGAVDDVAEALEADAAAAQNDPVPPGEKAIDPLLAQTEPRRVETETKTVRSMEQVSPADRAKALAALNVDRTVQSRFLSRYPDLVVYVEYSGRKDLPVKFKNGGFNTSDADLAQALRAHPRCNTVLFREEKDANTVALRQEAARQRAAIRSPSFAGPTTSHDGNESLYTKQDNDLAAIEHAAIDFGAKQ